LHLIDTPGGQVSGNSQETLSPKPATLSLGPLFKKASKVMVFLGVIWAGAALLNAFVFQTYYVNGLSMLPTLNDSDRLVVSKVSKTQAAVTGGTLMPKRGEIIVIDSQVSTFTAARNEQIIKRVIGLPGERVTVEQGKVTIYNESSPKGFNPDSQLGLQLAPSHTTSPIDIEVPDDSVFVMGDNRAAGGSLDSRDFGPVRLDLIEGILWVRILPLDQVHIF
jgi:signal peptidase I